jgi:mannose/cellobiose epimerase-like protein (N-acyl-D-glucosamine 2-epimerase family)
MDLRAWLLEAAIPLWLHHGVDRVAGAFHEDLAHEGYGSTAEFRRLRVAARQTYVFARAHQAGVSGTDEAVALGVAFLRERTAVGEGGCAARFDLVGSVIDPSLELYDQAFVLLAFATADAVLPAAGLRDDALRLLAFIEARFAHRAGGFVESLPPRLPRRQNPHMHLLEATVAAYAAFGDAAFLRVATSVVELLRTRFLDPATGALGEYFTKDLRPYGTAVIEPGHHCEWVWLLEQYRLAAGSAGEDVTSASAALMGFVDRFGHHPVTGDVVDELGADGAVTAATARLWPQTECLKAERARADSSAARRDAAAARLGSWLRPDGLWTERRDAQGLAVAGPSPASSLYHLTCAILDQSR